MNKHLEITTIAGCKVSCSYCPQALLAIEHKKVSDSRLMSLETFKNCLKTVPIDVDIHFSGYAEPFLNENCIDMIKYAFLKGHKISLYTTLVGVNLEHVKELEKITFKKINIHLADDGEHMTVNVDDNYKNVLNSLINSTIPNIKYLNYFGLHPSLELIIKNIELINPNLTSRAGNVETIVSKPKLKKGYLKCGPNRLEKNVLLPNGDVTLCCVDYSKKHVIGNLLANSYLELHGSEVFNEIKAMLKGKPGDLLCRTCEWSVEVKYATLEKIKHLIKSTFF